MDKTRFEKGINWGIIGVGDVCEVKSAPAMNLIEGSKLVAVMRRNGDKAADFARRHGVPKWYDDADALLNDPSVNAIYIATPPDSHAFYALKAAAVGKPVYVEKPMARTYAECLSMIEACEKAQIPLFTAYYRRELALYKTVKRLITEGVIGDVRFVDIKLHKPLQTNGDSWRIQPDIAGGGLFYDLGSHQLDIMDFLFGEIESAHGFAANQAQVYPSEDIVLGSFQFKNGILGQGSWCFNAPLSSETDLTTIYGSKGELSFTFFSNFHVQLKIDGKRKKIWTFEMPKHIQQPLIQTIVDDLQGKGTCVSTGVSGARTNWVMSQLCR
ncbi:MAG: Gfo/Idh/MocA family oxidoreductase [Saprospiraceae bacterium]|nr:Gfo/Idh/MocA family oxidoreductase [Saprospiraceae bacterium]